MKNIVVIGGGHGLATILKGIKHIDDINISCIVTVADNGGSTGRLRELYNLPAMGDIRNVMVALAEDEDILAKIMNYRFESKGQEFAGHNLGNLIITALSQIKEHFYEAVVTLSSILKIKGKIIPSTDEVVNIYARMDDDTIVKGEASIPSFNHRIKEIFYDHSIKASDDAIRAIYEADLIIYGIGSLYTSIIPNTIIPDINVALKRSIAKKVYFLNCMTQNNETYNYDLKDHLDALRFHQTPVDLIVKHQEDIPDHIKEKYLSENSIEVLDSSSVDVEVLKFPLLEFKNDLVRHDSQKIKQVVMELIKKYVI